MVNWQFTLCLSVRNRVQENFSQNSCSTLSFQLVLYTCAIEKLSLCVLAQDCCSLLLGVRLMVGKDYSSSSFGLRQALYIWTSGVEITPVADNLCFLHSARWIQHVIHAGILKSFYPYPLHWLPCLPMAQLNSAFSALERFSDRKKQRGYLLMHPFVVLSKRDKLTLCCNKYASKHTT